VEILTGGIARERIYVNKMDLHKSMIWCHSRADSIVWMEEDVTTFIILVILLKGSE